MEEQKDTCNTQAIKEEKQKQAIIYAIENYPLINRTKLMKYIFFIDLFTYNKTGDTLLEDCYIRLPNGPVPKYGFEYTSPPTGRNLELETPEFTIKKIVTGGEDNSEYYHFQFYLKPGVTADLSSFKENEKDLMELALQTMQSRRTAYLSKLTHTYKLWTSYINSAKIKLEDFDITDDQEEELELLLNTKVYLTPKNKDGVFKKVPLGERKRVILPEFPDRLPVYINSQTGEIIQKDNPAK